MARRKATDILFWVVAALGAALLVSFLLALAGVIPVDAPAEPTGTEESAPAEETAPATTAPTSRPRPTRTTNASPEPPATTEPPPATTTEPPPPPPPTQPTLTSVVITATRGDSWFQARAGSEEGRVLDERVLAQGQSAAFEAQRVWLSVGAAGNVDITVNGKPRAISPGTISLVLTRAATTAASS
jgi:hypothetical protein